MFVIANSGKQIDENIDKYRDNVIYCCKTLSNGGVVLTHPLFLPHILRGFLKSLKRNPGKNNPKNFTYFFV